MMKNIISSWPLFDQDEAEAVKEVVLSNKVNYWTGTQGREFEKEFANFCCANYAVAVSNGTVAIELALRSLNIGIGDDVIVTPRTFIASVSAIVAVGARPVFADVELNSGNISAETISQVLTPATKAVICVHLGGWPCDMDPILELSKDKNFKIIEDCAQSHGAIYKGRPVGSIGDVAAWSFCQDKIMTTCGEGGMVTTNSRSIMNFIWSYKDHGKCSDAVNKNNNTAGFRWVHKSFGSNMRMTEVQAVVGRIQLKKIRRWTEIRNRNASAIHNVCASYQFIRAPIMDNNNGSSVHAYYRYYAYINENRLPVGWTRNKIIQSLNDSGVPCFYGSCSEVYLESAFDNSGFRPDNILPNAKLLGDTSLCFLVHPSITEDELDRLCNELHRVLRLVI